MATLNAYNFESINVGPNPVGLSSSIYSQSDGQASSVFITCEGECRYTYHDKGIPTSTTGHVLSNGNFIKLEGELQITNFKAIAMGSEPATLSVSYERI